MKRVVFAYPEYLAIDTTYKLLKTSVPVYVIVAEDGACETEIVAICLLTTEDQRTLSWFVTTFKETNPATENTKCIITDKDMSERQVIRGIFPNASLIFQHVLGNVQQYVVTYLFGCKLIDNHVCSSIIFCSSG